MSALRKLRALKLAQTEGAAGPAAAESTTEAEPSKEQEVAAAKPANAFASLMEDEDDEERQVEAEESAEQQQPEAQSAPPPAASPPAGKAKKSKADKASAAGSAAASAGGKKSGGGKKKSAAAGSVAAAVEKEDWEIEAERAQAAAAAASAAAGKEASSSAADDPSNLWSLLRTDARSLDAAAEIRAVFGSGMERRPGGGGHADDDAAGAQQFMQGRNQGGFRRGGAATLRRAKANSGAATSSSSSSASSGAPRRMLVRQNPAWPRTDAVGLIKAQFVAPLQPPIPPTTAARAGKVATATSGMHSNIHSLADASSSAAASSAPTDEEQRAAKAQADYTAAVARYQRQQQLVLGAGVRVYTFVHSGEFQHQQAEYLQCVASHDVQQLSYFSRMHPFHPESLLTMSDIFASQSEFATSHEFIQRCLFVHENGWLGGGAAGGAGSGSAEMGHKLAAGLARMDGDAPENAPFFAALAKHAQTLGKKGTPRTAFAVCKLLLSLSPLLDPTCTLLCIDYYALRAKQFQFMVDFAAQMDRAVISAYGVGQHPWASQRAQSSAAAGPTSASNVATLSSPSAAATAASSSSSAAASSMPAPRAPCIVQPGLMYSRALAAWHLENEAAASAAGGGGAGDKRKPKPSTSSTPAAAAAPLFTGLVHPPSLPATAAGHSQIDAEEAALIAASASSFSTSSSYLLQQALLMWPSVLQPLLAAAGVGSALTRPAWVSVFAALDGLYASSSAWSLSSGAAAASLPASTPYLAKLELCYTERSSSLWKSDAIQAWILLNAQQIVTALSASPSLYTKEHMARFVAARSLLLSVPFPSAVKSLQKSAYSDHVPHLPPELLMAQNHMAFDVDGQRARVHAADLAAAGMQPLDMQQHPLRAFLQSLLPWFAVPEGGGVAQPPRAEGGAGAGAGAAAAGVPANMEEALAALQQMPAERREEVLRAMMGELGEAEEDEEQDEEEGEAQGHGEYDDYVFDD